MIKAVDTDDLLYRSERLPIFLTLMVIGEIVVAAYFWSGMIYTSTVFVVFLIVLWSLYWLMNRRLVMQNALLLCASYVFYGYVHPWFCVLIAASTVVDWGCALAIERYREQAKIWLGISIVFNLGVLSFFKYCNFFVGSVAAVLALVGWNVSLGTLQVVLPVGISFYTFQSMSYTIDVYRGDLAARRKLVDFALFVSFFPQLVAGPIERATHLLPQIEQRRAWDTRKILSAVPLFLSGYLKKLVVADNISVYVDRIFLLEHPSLIFLFVGALGFAIQIFADFSAYTDIARGAARVLGFELMENFKSPYRAISPSDFWRRWHISFSSWIRDYLYIPLGGSRHKGMRFLFILLVTMGLSGLWHGAAWNFVVWGLFHGAILFLYHIAGCGGKWVPQGGLPTLIAWALMQALTLFGWLLFRCPSLEWLWQAFSTPVIGISGDMIIVAEAVAFVALLYSLPWIILSLLERYGKDFYWTRMSYRWIQMALIALLANRHPQEFIYFQF